MSKITIEVKDLPEYVTAYNNAYLAYEDWAHMCRLGFSDRLPIHMQKHLKETLSTEDSEVWYEYFKNKLSLLKQVYDQLLEEERKQVDQLLGIEKNEQNKGN